MMNETLDPRKWADLGIAEKFKITVAGSLVLASIIMGFVSFIILLEIPTSVIGLDGLWLSTPLAVLGISSYFHNEMVQFQGRINAKIDRIGKEHLNSIE